MTLFIGLVSNLFTSIFVSKTLFELALVAPAAGRDAVDLVAMHIFKNTNYDFLRWRWHAVALSWVVILAGARRDLHQGHPAGRRVRRRHRRSSRSSTSRRRVEQVRDGARPELSGGGQNAIVQPTAIRRSTR